MEILKYIICAVLGYLLGSISFAVILSKLIKREDVREKGSRNAGATNVARVYGMKMGLLTFAGDFIKMSVSFGIGWLIMGETGSVVAGMGCVLGHCWPVFFRFRGGKGVVVGGAFGFWLDWRLFVILIIIFAVMFIITKRVSVGSLSTAVAFVPVLLLLGERGVMQIIGGIMCAVIVLVLHIPNIKRLINHTEGEFKPGK